MLNEEFLTGLLSNEEVSAEDKIKQIIAEHEADTRGLVQKKDELLGKEVKLKEQIAAFEKANGEYETKISEMAEQIKKANPEAHKQFYETQLADAKAKYDAEIQKVAAERDSYKQSHFKSLRDKAIENGIKDLTFVPGLKDGFVARVLSMNDFQPEQIEGDWKFLNKDHHTIEEALNSFALTQEGKAYIANPSTGGGARGSSGGMSFGNQKQVSSQQLDTMSDEQIMKFALDGGKVV
jgi:hypothetical protein